MQFKRMEEAVSYNDEVTRSSQRVHIEDKSNGIIELFIIIPLHAHHPPSTLSSQLLFLVLFIISSSSESYHRRRSHLQHHNHCNHLPLPSSSSVASSKPSLPSFTFFVCILLFFPSHLSQSPLHRFHNFFPFQSFSYLRIIYLHYMDLLYTFRLPSQAHLPYYALPPLSSISSLLFPSISLLRFPFHPHPLVTSSPLSFLLLFIHTFIQSRRPMFFPGFFFLFNSLIHLYHLFLYLSFHPPLFAHTPLLPS